MTSAYQVALEKVKRVKPLDAARNCGFKYLGSKSKGIFLTTFLNAKVQLSYPTFEGYFVDLKKKTPASIVTLLMYHLANSDGQPPANTWVSYTDLPGGNLYAKSMRNYTSKLIEQHFGNEQSEVNDSAKLLKADKLDGFADLAFVFKVLPKISIAFLYWKGDNEFSPRAVFLFDESAPHYLPTDCYAILCSWLTSSLIERKFFFED